MIEHGADVMKEDNDGSTPLHNAASNGHTELCKVLIEHGADVMKEDNDGNTPLHNAASKGHTELCKVLIEHGADVMKEDNDGYTPLHNAASNGHTELCKVLIEHGADVMKEDKNGSTPLHLMAKNKDFKTIEEILPHLNFSQICGNWNPLLLYRVYHSNWYPLLGEHLSRLEVDSRLPMQKMNGIFLSFYFSLLNSPKKTKTKNKEKLSKRRQEMDMKTLFQKMMPRLSQLIKISMIKLWKG